VWPLLDHLDELPDDPSHAALLAHLADGDERATRRRFPLARRIADLFDRYAMYRPEMVGGWSRGQDLDADGHPMSTNLAWQPILWRALRDRVAVPSPDERFQAAADALASDTIARPDDLPDDVTIFGVLGLPPLQLRLLDALSRHVPVTIHAIAPVPAWTPGPGHRGGPPPAGVVRHGCPRRPQRAGSHEPAGDDGGDREGTGHLDDPAGAAPATALAVLQADIRADRVRGDDGAAPHRLTGDDHSIQAHACHGSMRQLEVLREVLLGLLEDDHTLEPRDIVVLTPDITTWDPLIRAVFSDGDRPGDRSRHGASGDGTAVTAPAGCRRCPTASRTVPSPRTTPSPRRC
jgi:exodeoxyribonuclease V gamma subunit